MKFMFHAGREKHSSQIKQSIYANLNRNRLNNILLLCASLQLAACGSSNFASNTAVKTPTAAGTPTPTTNNVISNVCNQNLAIALVMDVSGSMGESAYGGSSGASWSSNIASWLGNNSNSGASSSPSKMSVNIQTAQNFVNQVTNANDMFGLVTFSDQAMIVAPMSTNKTVVQNALSQLSPEDGTNITGGLTQGAALLASVPAGYTKVLILISDGQNNGPGDPLSRAAIIKQSGVLVLTLGFMSDSGQSVMQAMATDPSDYFNSTDSASFISNFNLIAQKLCI